jgi:hypothetical protein
MLSLGEVTKKISKDFDGKKENAKERQSTVEFKKRRRERKERQNTSKKTCEVREGNSSWHE